MMIVVVVYDKSMLSTPAVMHVWAEHFIRSTGTDTEKLVSLDIYYSHREKDFLKLMRGGNSLVSFVPPDCTDLVQSNDRALGKTWKDLVTGKINQHLEVNWNVVAL